jgi:hypothetical protein
LTDKIAGTSPLVEEAAADWGAAAASAAAGAPTRVNSKKKEGRKGSFIQGLGKVVFRRNLQASHTKGVLSAQNIQGPA